MLFRAHDDERVRRLAEVLAQRGFRAVLDSPGKDSDLENALTAGDGRRWVLAVWSTSSAGEESVPTMVQMADAARRAGRLVHVRLEPVDVPPELAAPTVDLTQESQGDFAATAVDQLVAIIQDGSGGPRRHARAAWFRAAKFAAVGVALGRAVHVGRMFSPNGWRAVATGFTVTAGFLSVAADVAGVQTAICAIPGVRSGCAAIGIGKVPTVAEEQLWRQRPIGDCATLRTYLERFPLGAYADEATRRLQAAETRDEEHAVRETRRLPMTVRASMTSYATDTAAKADAVSRGGEEARRLCSGYTAAGGRVVRTEPAVDTWRCTSHPGGVVCGFDGEAVCELDVPRVEARQICR